MLDEMFIRVLEMSGGAAVTITVVLVLRWMLKKAPRKFSYALWFVVWFRLLCPITLELPWAIVPERRIEGYTLAHQEVSVKGAAEAAYQAVEQAVTDNTAPQFVRTERVSTNRVWVSSVQGPVYENIEPIYVPSEPWEVAILAGKYLWASGVVIMLLVNGMVFVKLRRRLDCAMPLQENTYLVDYLESPFVVGLINPRIYLPSTLGEQEQGYILLHEQHHIRRGDHVAKCLAFAALCVHWFNPLVWVAFVMFGKDMETSCDEAVMEQLDTCLRKHYSASLLNLATGRRIIASAPLAFGEGNTKDRIHHVMHYKKPVGWVIVLATVVLLVTGSLLLTTSVDRSTAVMVGYYDSVGMLYRDQLDAYQYSTRGGLEEGLPLGGTMKQRFLITEDFHLYRAEKQNTDVNRWEYVGQLEPCDDLTKEDVMAYTDHTYATIPRSFSFLYPVTDAYILYLDDDYFCQVFQTKNGVTYLGYGWEDKESRGTESDDTHLKVLYQLELLTEASVTKADYDQLLAEWQKETFGYGSVYFVAEWKEDSQKIWPWQPINAAQLADSSQAHIPLFRIHNEEELEEFAEFILDNFQMKHNEQGIPSITELLQCNKYDDTFFREQVLFVLCPQTSGEVVRYQSGTGWIEEGRLVLTFEKEIPEDETEGATGWIYLAEIEREDVDVEKCTEFDAYIE